MPCKSPPVFFPSRYQRIGPDGTTQPMGTIAASPGRSSAATVNRRFNATNDFARSCRLTIEGKFQVQRFEVKGGTAAILGLTGLFMLCFVAGIVQSCRFRGVNTFCARHGCGGHLRHGGLSAAGLFLLWFAREIGTSFLLDDQGITRLAWGLTTAHRLRPASNSTS